MIDVKRRDHLRQAVSWARMGQTGVYVVTPDQQPAAFEAVYDFEMITAMIGLIEDGERGWAAFYKELNLTPYKVVYEDLLTTKGTDTALRGIVNHLGVEASFAGPPAPRSLIQADELTEEWVARYLSDSK